MTDEEVKKAPCDYLAYFADKLTPKQFDYCVHKSPYNAIIRHADKLTKEQLDYCVHQVPTTAIRVCPDKLTKEQLDYCVRKEPFAALRFCVDKLTKEQLDYCERVYKMSRYKINGENSPVNVGQSRRRSLLESFVNILVGYSINFTANLLIFPIFGWHISTRENLTLGVIYTGISLVRSYGLRRFFNRKEKRTN